VYPDVSFYIETRNHQKTFQKRPKNMKRNNLLKAIRILNTEIQPERGPGFCIYLGKGGGGPQLFTPVNTPLLQTCIESAYYTRIE